MSSSHVQVLVADPTAEGGHGALNVRTSTDLWELRKGQDLGLWGVATSRRFCEGRHKQRINLGRDTWRSIGIHCTAIMDIYGYIPLHTAMCGVNTVLSGAIWRYMERHVSVPSKFDELHGAT